MSDFVTLFEVSPRDGLQNEPNLIPTEKKVQLVNCLSACGFRKIEAASFVSPKWVPQMADAEKLMAEIERAPNTKYTALTPNLKGFERAMASGADEVAIFGSASEGFSMKNINCSIDESLERFKPLVELALKNQIPVRGYVSCAIQCPYDGPTHPDNVADIAVKLIELGVYEVSLGDTIGVGTPETTKSMLEAVLSGIAVERLAGHFHNTNNRALENIEVSLDMGLRTFDASICGIGGCPFAGVTKGNVDTMEVLPLIESKGFNTGIHSVELAAAAEFAQTLRNW